ncbi:MAG: sensor histidine kinase [Eubacterium sp.]|nr:sensor histidine kinase [Eubacterium sp.]
MQDLGNKLLLYLAGCYLIWHLGVDDQAVIVVTLSLLLSCLCSFFKDSIISDILVLVSSLFCLIIPDSSPYLPLFMYDAIYRRQNLLLATGASAGVRSLLWLPVPLLFPYFLLFSFSFLLAGYSRKNQGLLRELHLIRDRSTEAEIHLKERNQALIQKQDSEIHAATLSERNRIAREIHDNVGHMLTRSILQTGALKVINQDPALEEPLDTLKDTLNTAMTSIRTSVHDLHDESIDLQSVLQEIASSDPEISLHLEYDVERELPRDIKYAFISIVKEAVNNIHKHSSGNSGRIIVREHPGFYLLQIRDNGTPENLPPDTDGIGLSGIRDRVQSLGGTLRINTTDGFLLNISITKTAR